MVKKQGKESKKNKKALIWITAGALLLSSLFAFKVLNSQRQLNEKRKVFEEQRQLMIDYWRSQGLSDKEIEEKMQNERELRNTKELKKSSGIGVVKLFTGGRGAGRK